MAYEPYDPSAATPGAPRIEPRRARLAPWLILGLLILVPAGVGLALSNHLVAKREAVDAAWAQVESNYQRRADLIPALVQAVKRHMRHEAETLGAVIEARGAGLARLEGSLQTLAEAQAGSARALAEAGAGTPADAAALQRIAASQAAVGAGLRQVFALAESYPTLRSADHFLELQAQLEGAENRINVARMRFNEAVRAYNAAIQKMPASRIARARGYERRAYFESDPGAARAPSLGFD